MYTQNLSPARCTIGFIVATCFGCKLRLSSWWHKCLRHVQVIPACYTVTTLCSAVGASNTLAHWRWQQFAVEKCRSNKKPIVQLAGDRMCVYKTADVQYQTLNFLSQKTFQPAAVLNSLSSVSALFEHTVQCSERFWCAIRHRSCPELQTCLRF
jgi:hypothetical protein